MSEATLPQTKPAPPSPAAGKPKKPLDKRKLRTIIALVLVAALLLGGGVALYRFLFSSNDKPGEILSKPAEIGSLQSRVAGSGSAKAKESAAITLTQGGTVQEVFVNAGETVTAGQPLYSIFSQAAQDEVTNAQKRVDSLQKDMADLQEQASNLTLRAPFSGKLTQVQSFEPEQEISAGTTVATLVNDKQLKLSLYFSYAYENSIYKGQSVQVSVPTVMRTFTGRVDEIHKVSFISPEGAVHFEVVIVFDNPGTLTAGMDASAILTASDGSSIYPYENGKTEYYESRELKTKAGGPLASTGNLRNYANVSAGIALLTMASDTIDSQIRAKQEELDEAVRTLETAQKALADFNAVAPIDGTVITCTLSPGAEVKSGDTVIIISNNTTMLVTINVDDKNISFIHPGDMVELDWNGTMFMGTVTAIDMGGAQSGSGMTTYPVTLTVDNFDGTLVDGAWLQYSFVTSQSDNCIIVPTSAVKYVSDAEGNRQSVVFVQRDSRPEDVPELLLPETEPGQKPQFPSEADGYYPVLVETGISDAENVEIISGIEEGDVVFVNFTVTDQGSSW